MTLGEGTIHQPSLILATKIDRSVNLDKAVFNAS